MSKTLQREGTYYPILFFFFFCQFQVAKKEKKNAQNFLTPLSMKV